MASTKMCGTVKSALKEAMKDPNCQTAGICVIVYNGQHYFGVAGGSAPRDTDEVLCLEKNKNATAGWSPIARRKAGYG